MALNVQTSFAGAGFCRDLLNTRQSTFSRDRLAVGRFERAEFPEIPPQELSGLVLGRPTERLFTAHYNGIEVMGKRLNHGSLKEAAWLQELNKLGLGVRFYGLTEIQGRLFFVMEKVPGYNTNVLNFGVVISSATVKEMRRQFDILTSNDIFPIDMQFQVGRDGQKVKIVDPEVFEIRAQTPDRIEKHWRWFQAVLRANFETAD